MRLSEEKRKLMLSYLWKIQANRGFILNLYQTAEQHLDELVEMIELEIGD